MVRWIFAILCRLASDVQHEPMHKGSIGRRWIRLFSREPAVTSGDVRRYGFPRTDLSVTLDGVTIKPALALGGWVAFKQMQTQAMVMGDLVLLESEINPVMEKMMAGGIIITGVHNHLLRANPATFYMHIGGHGDAINMATAIRLALMESKYTVEAARRRQSSGRD